MAKSFLRLNVLALAAAALIAAPAFAGECPAGKAGVDVTPPGPMVPSLVTDTVIASIDLGEGYDIPGRALRLRRLVIEPGGVVPWHSHEARPANIYVIKGQVTEYRSSCSVPIIHKKGEVVAESGATSHWWKNESRHRAILISSDILPPAAPADQSM